MRPHSGDEPDDRDMLGLTLLDLTEPPLNERSVRTYTDNDFYALAGDSETAISVPRSDVSGSRGVRFNLFRNWNWRIITGLHPCKLEVHAEHCLCVRRRNGYWTPATGLHSWRSIEVLRDGGGLDPPSTWHHLFAFHGDRLAVRTENQTMPVRREIDDPRRGWIKIRFADEEWQLHTSTGGILALLRQTTPGADATDLRPDFRAGTLLITVPRRYVTSWQLACDDRLEQALRLQISICSQ